MPVVDTSATGNGYGCSESPPPSGPLRSLCLTQAEGCVVLTAGVLNVATMILYRAQLFSPAVNHQFGTGFVFTIMG